MARSALYVFVAVASALHVAAQSTTGAPVPTFPVTPLVNLNFSYTALVCIGLGRIFSLF